MSYVCEGHRQTLLVDGRVLVTCGTAALYDPKIGAWTAAAGMRTARRGHAASRLRNGAVLVAGGTVGRDVTADAEIYDAVSDTWSQTGSLNSARAGAEAVLLQDGRVLIVGGFGSDTRTIVGSAEIYDPATGLWTVAAPMRSPRLWHTATLLGDGKVLVAGGVSAFTDGAALKTAELFDPATGAWSLAGEMTARRSGHTATLLQGGNVLIAGGPEEVTGTELFDPKKLAWTPAGDMREGRGEPSATLLPNGKVLVAGGYNLAVTFFYKNLDTSEIYDPVKQRWDAGPKLVRGRAGQQATLLKNGKVLITGGMADWDAEIVIADAEIFGAARQARLRSQ